MQALVHRAAREEIDALAGPERQAMEHAITKLEALGQQMGFPHSSAVKGADRLRELRPRAGRSPWRGFYRRVGDAMVVAAVGPEAKVDPQRFTAAVRTAEDRLTTLEQERARRANQAEGGKQP
jgi:hypothetical protein